MEPAIIENVNMVGKSHNPLQFPTNDCLACILSQFVFIVNNSVVFVCMYMS